PMRRIGSLVALALSAVLLGAAPVHAQPADPAALHQRYRQLHDSGKYAEALQVAQQLEAQTKAKWGAQSAEYARPLFALGRTQMALGNFQEADEAHNRALAIRRQALGANHAEVAESLVVLAESHRRAGRYGEAETLIKQALGIWESAAGANQRNIA